MVLIIILFLYLLILNILIKKPLLRKILYTYVIRIHLGFTGSNGTSNFKCPLLRGVRGFIMYFA